MVPRYRAWLVMLVVFSALVVTYRWASPTDTEWKRTALREPDFGKVKDEFPPATLNPGRVVVLQTSKGNIELVLLEKDCPKTTKFIAGLVQQGSYNGKQFVRVDKNGLIKTAECTKGVKPIRSEFRRGLLHEKGAVGLAKWTSAKESSGAIYILPEPQHNLDYDYTAFGRVIAGMDVVNKIRVGDVIQKATARPLTKSDMESYNRVLKIEVERQTE